MAEALTRHERKKERKRQTWRFWRTDMEVNKNMEFFRCKHEHRRRPFPAEIVTIQRGRRYLVVLSNLSDKLTMTFHFYPFFFLHKSVFSKHLLPNSGERVSRPLSDGPRGRAQGEGACRKSLSLLAERPNVTHFSRTAKNVWTREWRCVKIVVTCVFTILFI